MRVIYLLLVNYAPRRVPCLITMTPRSLTPPCLGFFLKRSREAKRHRSKMTTRKAEQHAYLHTRHSHTLLFPVAMHPQHTHSNHYTYIHTANSLRQMEPRSRGGDGCACKSWSSVVPLVAVTAFLFLQPSCAFQLPLLSGGRKGMSTITRTQGRCPPSTSTPR